MVPLTLEDKKAIYEQIVAIVKKNVPDDFTVTEHPGRIEIDTQRPVVIDGRKHDHMSLLSVIIQKHHIGFYFMPVYVKPELRNELSDPLDKLLKGKSCFIVKRELSPEIESEVAELVRKGVQLYQEREWI
jgi:hypothetical protein